jgi:hypothetical protein
VSNFLRYDFDKDGFIRKEDVRLILSHVPIDKTSVLASEGRFTSQGGGGYVLVSLIKLLGSSL